jgi:hypothetical protein
MKHKTKLLSHNGEKIPIDVDIAGLISNVWKLGIDTFGCCQSSDDIIGGRKNDVWIVFSNTGSFERFLDAVAVFKQPQSKSLDSRMYSNILGHGSDEPWKVDVWYDNHGLLPCKVQKHAWTDQYCEKNEFVVRHILWFPRAHLPYVERQVQLAVAALKKAKADSLSSFKDKISKRRAV